MTLPKNKELKIRRFLNKSSQWLAAIKCTFHANYRYSSSYDEKSGKIIEDKSSIKTSWGGSVEITDCTNHISLDFYGTKKQALYKLNILIDSLEKCREFVENYYEEVK